VDSQGDPCPRQTPADINPEEDLCLRSGCRSGSADSRTEGDSSVWVPTSRTSSHSQVSQAPVEPCHASHEGSPPGTSVDTSPVDSELPRERITATSSSVPETAALPSRPETRLKHVISKSKVYIDGTVRYGLATSKDEAKMNQLITEWRWKILGGN
jgi:hypothetical protein